MRSKPEDKEVSYEKVAVQTTEVDAQKREETKVDEAIETATVEAAETTPVEVTETKEIANPQVTAEIPPKAAVSSFSLSSIALKKNLRQKEKQSIPSEALPSEPYTQEQLDQVWESYIATLNERGSQNMVSLLRMAKPTVDENYVLTCSVANDMNQNELVREMEHFLPILKEKLNHYDLKIKFVANKKVHEEVAVSTHEKFAYLLKINPNLAVLKDKFDLEI